ncbi:MAG: ribonuclease J [Lactobacillales bacterium]|nr:ribonuclease J [Lactobacillales bacterium]
MQEQINNLPEILTDIIIPPEKFVFIPIGGATEIGMNFFAYGYKGKWLLVDCGVGFAGEDLPGIDLLLPNPVFFRDKKKDIVGLIITHAHADHIDGLPYLWRDLQCPVYASPFASEFLEIKLDEAGLLGRVEVNPVAQNGTLDLDPFEIEFISMNHSLPEPQGLAIRTKEGLVIHTGDWKFDAQPLLGEKMDLSVLEQYGKEGVLALVSDSTDVSTEKSDKTEVDVRHALEKLIGEYPAKQIAITCFASNVARMESIYHAAVKNGRQVCLMGRSLWRIDAAGRATGYFKDIPEFLSEDEAAELPKEKVLYVCTGSQGEPFSGLSTLASGTGKIKFEEGDVVVFSSRVIPGNEKKIAFLQKRLKAKKYKIITDRDALVHVSGHYGAQDLEKMYRLLKPKISLPVHGAARELTAHAELALKWGTAFAFTLEEGEIITLDDTPQILGEVPTGILAVDGKKIVQLNSGTIKKRRKMVDDGSLFVTLVLDADGNIYGQPKLSAIGLLDEGSEDTAKIIEQIKISVGALEQSHRDDMVEGAVRTAIRRFLNEHYGKKPIIDVHLIRI